MRPLGYCKQRPAVPPVTPVMSADTELNSAAPCFIALDGLDGTGKSTQQRLLAEWLRKGGHKVVTCRDPGTTPLGEKIRSLLLDRDSARVDSNAEMLLYMAARAQLVDEVIRPALTAQTTVISDRFLLSNIVYQGYARGLDLDDIRRVGELATGGVRPDLTFVLNMSSEAALARIRRGHDRMEHEGAEFHKRVREGFLAEAAKDPERIVVIDAARGIEHVHADIRGAVETWLANSSRGGPRLFNP